MANVRAAGGHKRPAPDPPAPAPAPVPAAASAAPAAAAAGLPGLQTGITDPDLSNLLMAWYFSGYYTGYYQVRRAALVLPALPARVLPVPACCS